jgi:7-cyano-7-deazaguanine synthase
MKAVVLLSGGVDSSTTLAIARSEGFEIYALSFDYNQRHRRELESAKAVASSLGVKKHLVLGFDLREIGGSALTSEIEVPKDRGGEASSFIPITYVPARNTIFLSFGLAWAEVLEAGHIYVGANAVDYSGYPDCRPEYLKAFEEMANLATKISVEGTLRFSINAPLVSMKKSDIIKEGARLGLDYALTWSCYDPQSTGAKTGAGPLQAFVPCGRCDSCIIRAKGFSEAGIEDPLSGH